MLFLLNNGQIPRSTYPNNTPDTQTLPAVYVFRSRLARTFLQQRVFRQATEKKGHGTPVPLLQKNTVNHLTSAIDTIPRTLPVEALSDQFRILMPSMGLHPAVPRLSMFAECHICALLHHGNELYGWLKHLA